MIGPHPVMHGTWLEVLHVFVNNVRALGLPFGLHALGLHNFTVGRRLGHAAVGGTAAWNVGSIVHAIVQFGDRLVPYLHGLPLELSALACALAVWFLGRHVLRLALAVLVLLAGAAILEVMTSPHVLR